MSGEGSGGGGGEDCGVLLLTHGGQGACLLESVSHMLGEAPPQVVALSLVGTERRSEIEQRCHAAAAELRRNNSRVLILTDLYGSTQAGIAEKIAAADKAIACVHGVNLVMLLEAVAMRQLPLKKLQQQVAAAARQSVQRSGG